MASTERVIADALSLACVVTYARPFLASVDRFGYEDPVEARHALASLLCEGLPDPGQHVGHVGNGRDVAGDRNAAYAHSDARPRDVQIYGEYWAIYDVAKPLEEWVANSLLANVLRMRENLRPLVDRVRGLSAA